MIFLIKLLLAHLIGDFLLQPTSWVKDKESRKAASGKLYLHILVHVGLMFLIFWDFSLWLPILLIGSSHLVIDLLKLYLQRDKTMRLWFLIDQVLHLLSILAVLYFWKNPDIELQLLSNLNFILYLTAIVFLSFPVSVIMRMLLHHFSRNINDHEDESLINAGTYIGILERLLIFVFIAIDHWEAVGFLLAAKSIFRFGDLKESKDRKLTEYILIGTLLSFGIAIITGLAVQHLIFLF